MPYETDIMNFTNGVLRNTAVPSNTMNKVLVTDPAGKYQAHGIFKKGSIIETDSELAIQKGLVENFGDIFNYWTRISRGGASYSDAYLPSELNGWQYNASTDRIACTINSAWLVGFISPDKFDSYVLDVQLSSTANDDDFIGVIIAHARDPVTGNTHTLAAMRGANGSPPITVYKDYVLTAPRPYMKAYKWDGLNFPDGTVATPGKLGGNWNIAPLGCRLRVTRKGDIITVETGQFGTTTLFDPAKIEFDLSTDPQLEVFRGPQSYGYCAQSQQWSTYAVTERPTLRYPIIDIRDWTTWTYNDGTWVSQPNTKDALIAQGLLKVDWMHQNETSGKFFYLDPLKQLYRL